MTSARDRAEKYVRSRFEEVGAKHLQAHIDSYLAGDQAGFDRAVALLKEHADSLGALRHTVNMAAGFDDAAEFLLQQKKDEEGG